MKLAKVMLCYTAFVWILYGGWLTIDPLGIQYLGYELNHWSAIVEVQAMYGLAEVMLGVYALLGVLRPQNYLRPALLLWCMIYSGLWIGRVISINQWDGSFAIDFGQNFEAIRNSYNPGAIYFLELPSSILLLIAFLKTKDHPELAR